MKKKRIGKPIRIVYSVILVSCLLIGYLCLRGQEKEQSDVSVQTEEENVGNWENTENKKTAESVESTEDKKIAESAESVEDKEPAKSVNSAELKQYYGVYEIAEFWPTLYFFRGHRFDKIREQEADMMLGHFVEIQKDSLVTYECFRWEGVYDGKSTRIENYQIEKVSIENPAYEWESRDPALTSLEEFVGQIRMDFPCATEFENCREKIRGRITVTVEAPYVQEYYVMEDGIMMHSTMTGEFFYLKKLDKKPDKVLTAEALAEEEKEKIIQDVYGSYTITEFLPTKFYPALDVAGDVLLPQEEADMMIGREIVIDDQLFTTYDNGRLPNSEAANRSMEEYLLEKIEITTPDYQIERKLRDDIFGLRDDMLPEEMQQEEYIEINVYPGYGESIFDSLLPQMYQMNDGRLLLYAMGEYFLLEKKEAVSEPFVYQDLLAEYERVMEDESYMEEEWSNNIYDHVKRHIGKTQLSYCIKDLAGDGKPELILGVYRHEEREILSTIYESEYEPFIIYTYDDEGIHWNCISEEYIMTIYKDGIVEFISGGNWQHFMYKQVEKNEAYEKNMDIIVCAQVDDEEADYYKYEIEGREYKDITEEEFYNIRKQYTAVREELEWRPVEGFWNAGNIE